ncbi:MAG: hypothetical protein A2289_27200 [Deltaproteobacteria bacterium RIFOXYA12_FULL_58_15]|nr:MAG: hypothetical protein A2289_27200 [Deltaproteobacteria bacterium RIFOXYA12_FULL_58_15]OGR08281.1 MAG: hypothetical protein A2341_20270 [Deltaproteobacteria bacterium RIFOXYB12_FULL_58_9]
MLLILDLVYIAVLKPDWDTLATGRCPKSLPIEDYERARQGNRKLARLRWQPVGLSQMSKRLQQAVVAAEDARFHQHAGVDFAALGDAIAYAKEKGEVGFGASTISQQTIKNLVVGDSRTPWRKWHEMILALWMEQNLSKQRILSLYLNVAELGEGIYGAEAAAQAYWRVSANDLSESQAIEMAATLPSPKKHNPLTRTETFLRRVEKIRGHMNQFGWLDN